MSTLGCQGVNFVAEPGSLLRTAGLRDSNVLVEASIARGPGSGLGKETTLPLGKCAWSPPSVCPVSPAQELVFKVPQV